jgi:hypothetical protein
MDQKDIGAGYKLQFRLVLGDDDFLAHWHKIIAQSSRFLQGSGYESRSLANIAQHELIKNTALLPIKYSIHLVDSIE